MKVLFAVNNENISESIVKLYQKQYKEIISGKNVYYFNAIIKELQRDPTYDSIVISEDLEPYSNNSYNMIDKFLFEQLDKISDEAIGGKGGDIPIIFIATDRRSKSDALLNKLFSIGIYNALLGTDRSIPEICKLLNKPRSKKDAKLYYKIESEEVGYQAESEGTVSETEIRNILTHYKKLGKNTDRYVESFNNIAAQYNDAQLRIITKFLPINVKAVLESDSPKYQSIMTFGEGTYKKPQDRKEKKQDLNIGFIETHSNKSKPSGPVVIPSAVNKENVQRLTNNKNISTMKRPENTINKTKIQEEITDEIEEDDEFSNLFDTIDEYIYNVPVEEQSKVEPAKKGRGRPKKQIIEPEDNEIFEEVKPKRRGRPKKQTQDEEAIYDKDVLPNNKEDSTNNNDDLIMGYEPEADFSDFNNDVLEQENILPGFGISEDNNSKNQTNAYNNSNYNNNYKTTQEHSNNYIQNMNTQNGNSDLTRYLSKDKKIVSFVGTTKAGTSFLINNIADYLSKTGISTAILDLTSNKNSYYIYTKNEEALRRKTQNCIENLEKGIVEGLDVNRNLSVFTSIPGKKIEALDIEAVLSSLVQKYSLILLDCDFETPFEYFRIAQEIYLVQSMDILTIQPLTAFLRDLQSANILDIAKLKIIINKVIKVRGLSIKAIVGGLSCYNDPQMSYMKELFNKDKINTLTMSYDEDVLSRYLSGMVDCVVNIDGYSKQFLSELKVLSDTVYPLVNSKFKTDYTKNNKFANTDYSNQNNFSSSMNSTLDKMKNTFK